MNFLSRRLVMPNDLDYANALFGGRALEWIDEEAAIFAICQLETNSLVTKHIGAISFESPALQGDIVEFGLKIKKVGITSITLSCLLRNKATKKTICLADDIVFVQIDPVAHQPIPHGKTAELLAI
jgi:acyl-CoA hydrolase